MPSNGRSWSWRSRAFARRYAPTAVLCTSLLQACGARERPQEPLDQDGGALPWGDASSEAVAFTPVVASEQTARELMGEDWVGHALGLPLPRVYDLGPTGVSPALELPPHGEHALVGFYKKRAYLIDVEPSQALDEHVAKLREIEFEAMIRSMDPTDAKPEGAASDAPETHDGTLGVKLSALKIGNDDRKRLGIIDGWNETSWYAAIGAIARPSEEPIGTGTLVGKNLMLTAAHVVVIVDDVENGGGPIIPDIEFNPRADGSRTPDLQFPWGNWDITDGSKVFVPPFWVLREGGAVTPCYVDASSGTLEHRRKCIDSDWAIVILERPPAAAALARWMDYRPLSPDVLKNGTLKNRGYPMCSVVSVTDPPPPVCETNTLYGSDRACAVMDILDQGQRILHDCDTSQGQSGSPMYVYLAQRPVIGGIHTHSCLINPTTQESDPNCTKNGKPYNQMTGITNAMVTQINLFKQAHAAEIIPTP